MQVSCVSDLSYPQHHTEGCEKMEEGKAWSSSPGQPGAWLSVSLLVSSVLFSGPPGGGTGFGGD